jgi:hypothetical protein
LVSKRTERQVPAPTKDITFRTASSEQDPETDWVYPAKELDLTGYIMDLNSRMSDTMSDVVPKLIETYIEEYG